ncbi:unnamed protein product [Ectocarpus sp. 6 AP-2014]
MLAHFSSRCRVLGVLRVCHLGFGSPGCHAGVSSVLVLNRQAGGRPGKRRNHRGDYKFVDKLRIVASGGKGGDGCISLEGDNPTRKRPSGGSGGAGGNVYAIADGSLETLDSQLHHFNGQPGNPGGGSGKKGRTGKDAYIRVPCGTLVSEMVQAKENYEFHPWALAGGIECGGEKSIAQGAEGEEGGKEPAFDGDSYWGGDIGEEGEEEVRYVADLEKDGDKVLLASGGKPGLGNLHVASRRVGTKIPGQRGESRHYRFELRTIADVGLVGYPNAGKSTLLGCITSAKPKVAMYPFTTLTPVVGHVEYSDTIRLRVADIPGLIDGAHRNRGLGHEFLRHVSRTRALMFVVDAAGSEGRDPVDDLMSLKEELRLYDGELAGKPAFVVANKTDLQETEGHLERLRSAAGPLPVVPISALESRGLLELVVTMRQVLEEHSPGNRTDTSGRESEVGDQDGAADGGRHVEEAGGGGNDIEKGPAVPGITPTARWMREEM